MLPKDGDYEILKEYEAAEQTSRTYRFDRENSRIKGTYNEYIEAVRQSVYLILNTERYTYNMFSWNYGIELSDLFGREKQYVVPMLMKRIKEALIQDDRIDDVKDFSFEVKGGVYTVNFTVVTKYSEVDIEGVSFSV
ncbi:MAG: DUF2634 domain-containing protein [Clostridiales bacterium]|nr:DUF2634 domain-containing protein [Clostridiales bacterium]